MFVEIRYQTGETEKVIKEMSEGKIPKMDVVDIDELNWYLERLKDFGIYTVEGEPYDRTARDTVQEPEFECRISFYTRPVKKGEIGREQYQYIDFYFEPFQEETYDSTGEM